MTCTSFRLNGLGRNQSRLGLVPTGRHGVPSTKMHSASSFQAIKAVLQRLESRLQPALCRLKAGLARALPACWVAALLAVVPLHAAPPRLDAVFPGGGCRGQSTVLTAAGDWSVWPVQAWVDRPGIELLAGDAKGELRLNVAADAEPGVYWFRLHQAEGATGLKPLVIGTLAETTETEPNNGPQAAHRLELPVTVNGRLERSGDVDVFAASLQAGQTLVASLEAHCHLASPMDGVLQLCDAGGFVLAQCDDYRGLDPQLVFEVPRDGLYHVRVFAFPANPDSNINFAGGPELRLSIDAYYRRISRPYPAPGGRSWQRNESPPLRLEPAARCGSAGSDDPGGGDESDDLSQPVWKLGFPSGDPLFARRDRRSGRQRFAAADRQPGRCQRTDRRTRGY